MLKKLLKIFLIALLIPLLLFVVGVVTVFYYDSGHKTSGVYDYGIVFGAALRGKGKLSGTLESRMNAAIRLYREGSVKKLVLSGAKDPSEPLGMLHYALRKNVEPKDIVLDEEGSNTLKTMLNAQKKYGETGRILFISSSFHLARIKITAKLLGIKNADLYASETPHPKVIPFVFRESVALWYYIFKGLALRWF